MESIANSGGKGKRGNEELGMRSEELGIKSSEQ